MSAPTSSSLRTTVSDLLTRSGGHSQWRCPIAWPVQSKCPFWLRHQIASRRSILAMSSSSDESKTSTSQPSNTDYSYNSEEGVRPKATIEQVFGRLEEALPPANLGSSPWEFGWQMSERNITWNDDLKIRLIKRIASEELGISDEEMDWRLQQLLVVLPGLRDRLVKAPPKLVARLAAHTSDIALRVLQLKDTFPQADISAMVSNRLSLLLDDDMAEVATASARLRELLPEINVDLFVEAFPLVLDVGDFEVALQDAERIMPGVDVTKMLRSNPDMILSLIKGKNLIPYDEFANPWS